MYQCYFERIVFLVLGITGCISLRTKFLISDREEIQFIDRYGSELLHKLPLKYFIGDIEVVQKFNAKNNTFEYRIANPTNSSHSNLVAVLADTPQEKGEDAILYESKMRPRSRQALMLSKNDRLPNMTERRVYVGMKRNTQVKDKDSFFLALGYIRYTSQPSLCMNTYLHELICFEWDTWEERGGTKQSYKYFGYLDCSTSVFQSCRFNRSVLQDIGKLVSDRTKGLVDIADVNDTNPSKPQVHNAHSTLKLHHNLGINVDQEYGPGADYTYSLFYDLDINQTEGRFIRHAIRLFSVIADPSRVFATILTEPSHARNADEVKGKLFEWMFKMTEQQMQTGITRFSKDLDGDRAHFRNDIKEAAEKRRLLKYNLKRSKHFIVEKSRANDYLQSLVYKSKLGSLAQIMNDTGKKLKFLVNPVAEPAMERAEKFKGKKFSMLDKLPASVPVWSSSEILNRVSEEVTQHETPLSHKIGHALTDAIPNINITNTMEDMANKIANSILFSTADIFQKPGWKMFRYANVTSLECLRVVFNYTQIENATGNLKFIDKNKTCDYFNKTHGFQPKSLVWTEKVVFYGFGGCNFTKYKTKWEKDEIQSLADISPPPNFALDHERMLNYAKILRTHCTPHTVKYWEKMIEEGYLEKNVTMFRIPGEMSKVIRHTPTGFRMLCHALELQIFSQTLQKRIQERETWSGSSPTSPIKSISRSIDFLLEMSLEYIKVAREFDIHFIKLCRSLVLTLRTVMVRLIQDQELLHLWCPLPIRKQCSQEIHKNHKDKLIVNTLILFIIHGLGPVEKNKYVKVNEEFMTFFIHNSHEMEMALEYYDL